MSKRHKGGSKGLLPLKKRKKIKQLAKKAGRQQKRKESRKVVPGGQ